ncbi:hypothetical protein E2562_025860 [Oryza meyeriana var. granulata]|uniref:Uncharacterized protein n=1 Tax=Oryza meyeriana var. granulata TaxID=110450 RepID=A0A6G1BYR7_9ORYZ|nr:hypothetical protein E2562_025860 [Oryza meyeriana var. granulata]
MSAVASRPWSQGVVRKGKYYLNERCPGPGTLGVCPSMGGLTGAYHRFELTRAWAGPEVSTTTSKTLGLKYCVLGGYR